MAVVLVQLSSTAACATKVLVSHSRVGVQCSGAKQQKLSLRCSSSELPPVCSWSHLTSSTSCSCQPGDSWGTAAGGSHRLADGVKFGRQLQVEHNGLRTVEGGWLRAGSRASAQVAATAAAKRSRKVSSEAAFGEGRRVARLQSEKRDTITIAAPPQSTSLPPPPSKASSSSSSSLRQNRTMAAFLSLPAGRMAMVNERALKKIVKLDETTFRCYLPDVDVFKLRVAPVVDLQVTAEAQRCIVEMTNCRFEGSPALEEQNKRFRASMRNELRWQQNVDGATELRVEVQLNVALEVYTLPFTLLPLSAVEVPGSTMLSALLDGLLPLFIRQLVSDYSEWAKEEDGTNQGPKSEDSLTNSDTKMPYEEILQDLDKKRESGLKKMEKHNVTNWRLVSTFLGR